MPLNFPTDAIAISQQLFDERVAGKTFVGKPFATVAQYDTFAKNWSRWTNKEGGTLAANMRFAEASYTLGTFGDGKWRTTEDGLYCVNILWVGWKEHVRENWCKAIYEVGDTLYLAPYELDLNVGHLWGQIRVSN